MDSSSVSDDLDFAFADAPLLPEREPSLTEQSTYAANVADPDQEYYLDPEPVVLRSYAYGTPFLLTNATVATTYGGLTRSSAVEWRSSRW